MAGGRHDHPNFTVRQQVNMPAVQGPAASLTDFAHFRSRNKCIVDYIHVQCTSVPSAATSWSLQVMRGTTTIAAHPITSFSVVGSVHIFTLASLNTLSSIGQCISLEMDGTEKGKFDIMYEYRLLPDN